jgi:hypothetical protein
MKDVKKSFRKTLAKKISSLGVKNDFGPQHGYVKCMQLDYDKE